MYHCHYYSVTVLFFIVLYCFSRCPQHLCIFFGAAAAAASHMSARVGPVMLRVEGAIGETSTFLSNVGPTEPKRSGSIHRVEKPHKFLENEAKFLENKIFTLSKKLRQKNGFPPDSTFSKAPGSNPQLPIFGHPDTHRRHGLPGSKVGGAIDGIHHPQPTCGPWPFLEAAYDVT